MLTHKSVQIIMKNLGALKIVGNFQKLKTPTVDNDYYFRIFKNWLHEHTETDEIPNI